MVFSGTLGEKPFPLIVFILSFLFGGHLQIKLVIFLLDSSFYQIPWDSISNISRYGGGPDQIDLKTLCHWIFSYDIWKYSRMIYENKSILTFCPIVLIYDYLRMLYIVVFLFETCFSDKKVGPLFEWRWQSVH